MGFLKQKICLLGAFAVGKTSLVERFVHERFDEKYLTTVGISVSQKLMPPFQNRSNGRTVQHMFLIWDIAGLEKFDPMVINYFRGASGALAVADLTRPETIDNLGPICKKFMSVNPQAAMITIGNKLDLFKDDGAAHSGLKKLASAFSAEVILTSAKSGHGIETAFNSLAQHIDGSDG